MKNALNYIKPQKITSSLAISNQLIQSLDYFCQKCRPF